MKRLLAIALLFVGWSAPAQMLQSMTNANVVASGVSLTGSFGGTSYCNSCSFSVDGGNAGSAVCSYYVTPANTTSLASLNVISSASLTGTTWGDAIYTDNSGFGTISCSGTACTIQSGNTYSTQWAGDPILIGGVAGTQYTISTGSGSSITLTSSAGTTGTVAYQVLQPGSKVCGTTSTATQNLGINTLTPGSCTQSSSTAYWACQYTTSGANPAEATTSLNSFAAQGFNKLIITQFSNGTITPWPTNFPATQTGSGVPGNAFANGVYGTFATLNYTSAAPYNVVAQNNGNCDTNGTCAITIAPVGSSAHRLIVATVGSIGNTVSSVKDCTSASSCSSSTDTLTQMGCGAVSGGFQLCLYYTMSPTVGINNVTVSFASGGSGKDAAYVLEVQGPGTGSADKSCFDSAYLPSTLSGACSTATTTQASEFLLGVAISTHLQNVYTQDVFTAGGSWSVLYQGGGAGGSGSVATIALFTQTTSSTGAAQVAGANASYTSSSVNLTAVGTFK